MINNTLAETIQHEKAAASANKPNDSITKH